MKLSVRSIMIRRNKLLLLLVMPFGFALFFLVWSLYWVGSKKIVTAIEDKRPQGQKQSNIAITS